MLSSVLLMVPSPGFSSCCQWVTFSGKILQICHKELDTFDKIGVCAQHHHVYGIEVFFTPETPCQVGFLHRGRLKFSAKGTKEPEKPFALLTGNQQFFFDEHIDGYGISQLIELLGGKPSFHLLTSFFMDYFWADPMRVHGQSAKPLRPG
jgi:hypothetical protein